ncbi:MAG: FAD-dependent oxidoreductase [Bacteroidales bacterium]|nr:FAD-dependent oxidoreductase [Bacteroidales bacterium]
MKRKVIVIGAGITGMALAAFLAKEDFLVEIFEKHDQPGGRARRISTDQFSFDLGPQVIFLPEILEFFFNHFSHPEYLLPELERMDPSYRVFNNNSEVFDIPGEPKKMESFFMKYSPSGISNLNKYLERGRQDYAGITEKGDYFKGDSGPCSFLTKLFTTSHDTYVSKLFRDYHLVNLLQDHYPLVNQNIRDNSSLKFALNYSFLTRGVLYPKGGMQNLIHAFTRILDELNVPIHVSSPVESFDIIDDKVAGIITHGKNFHADYFVSAMDYRHTEQQLPKEYRNYSEYSWEPGDKTGSSFIFYLVIKKKLKNLAVNNIIYTRGLHKRPGVRDKSDLPVIHVTCPSKHNQQLAPEGMETLIIRTMVPTSIEDTGKIREHYFEKSIRWIEETSGESIQNHVIFKKTLAHTDFEVEFGTYQGLPFGWMNSQYSLNKKNKKMVNMKLQNLLYGEYPVLAGLGISSAVISGQVVAQELARIAGT